MEKETFVHIQVNFHYEVLAIKVDRQGEFNDFKSALLIKNKEKLKEIFTKIKLDFNKELALDSKFITYQKLSMPKNYVDDFYFPDIERCLKHVDPSILEDKNCFTEISMDIQISSYFHYFMNGFDPQLWNYNPLYYLPETLITSENLDILYDKSKAIQLESRLFTEFDQWKEISYLDIKKYFIQTKPKNKLDKFFQKFFKECINKKLIIVINKSNS